jgi:hypothetical protein
MAELRSAQTFSVRNHQGNTSAGSLRCGKGNNFKMDYRQVDSEGVERIQQVQNMSQHWVLMNMVMNLLVPQGKEFLVQLNS